MALRDVLVNLGVNVAGREKIESVDVALKNLSKSVKNAGTMIGLSLGAQALGGIIRSVRAFTFDVVEQADVLKHNAERLGVTTDELQKYQYVSGVMGVSTQQTAVSLRFFNRVIGEAELGTKGANKTFAQLGISIRDAQGHIKPTNDLLFEFSDALKLKDQPTRTALAMKTLGRAGTAILPALQNGSAALKDMFKDVDELGGGFSPEFINNAHEVDRQLKRVAFGWQTIKGVLAKELLPVVIKFLERGLALVKWLIKANKETYAFGSAVQFLKAVLVGVIATFAILNVEMIPTLALVTGIAVAVGIMYLIFDDFFTLMQGGDSVVGDFLDKMGGAGTALKFARDLSDAWDQVAKDLGLADGSGKSLVAGLAKGLPNIIGLAIEFGVTMMATIDTIITGFMTLFRVAKGTMEFISNPRGHAYGETFAALTKSNEDWEKRQKDYSKVYDVAGRLTGESPIKGPGGGAPEKMRYSQDEKERFVDDEERSRTENPEGTIFTKPQGAAGAGGAASQPMQVTITNHITGVSDAKGTAAAVGKATKDGVKSAMNRNRDAYAAATAGAPAVTGGN